MALELNGTTGVNLIQDGTVTAADLASGAAATNLGTGNVTASMLASTLDLTGKTVTLPAGAGGKVLGISTITHDSTNADYNVPVTQLGSLPVYYASGAVRSASYTKQSATSILLVHFAYSFKYWGASAGLHTFIVYKDSSNYKILGTDPSGISTTAGRGMYLVSGTVPFTGLGTGSHTFNMVPCRGTNAGNASHSINGGAQPDQSTPSSSFIYIVEVEA